MLLISHIDYIKKLLGYVCALLKTKKLFFLQIRLSIKLLKIKCFSVLYKRKTTKRSIQVTYCLFIRKNIFVAKIILFK